jgi:hypothetical protein
MTTGLQVSSNQALSGHSIGLLLYFTQFSHNSLSWAGRLFDKINNRIKPVGSNLDSVFIAICFGVENLK